MKGISNLKRKTKLNGSEIQKKNHIKFEDYLENLESPNYQGGSQSLPENPTPLELSKHEICREILLYQRKHKLTDQEIAQQIELTLPETENILYYRTNCFTLDRLLTYANKLFKDEPLKVGIVKA